MLEMWVRHLGTCENATHLHYLHCCEELGRPFYCNELSRLKCMTIGQYFIKFSLQNKTCDEFR